MKKLLAHFAKYELWLLALLKPLGIWGAGALALIDAAAVPVPLDLILAGYIWADKRHFYFYVLIAAFASAMGGLVPFLLGRAGGELFLMKRIDRQKYEKLRDRFEKQEFLAMMIPSILPPPTPWKLFVFGAGVFEMRLANFMLSVFTGRLVRYMILAVLTIHYGPQIVRMAIILETQHRRIMALGLLLIVGLLVLWVLYKRRGKSEKRLEAGDPRAGESGKGA